MLNLFGGSVGMAAMAIATAGLVVVGIGSLTAEAIMSVFDNRKPAPPPKGRP